MVGLVGGHFAEASGPVLDLVDKIANAVAQKRWVPLGYKSALGGYAPAKWGIMR